MKHRIRGQGANDVEAFASDLRNCRLEYINFFTAHIARFAGMRVKAGYSEPRIFDAKVALKSLCCRA